MVCYSQFVVMVATFLAPTLEVLGQFDQKKIPEASGLVKSRHYPGIFWTHNDSGNAPVLYAVHLDGSIAQSFRIAVPNIDWEDIAIDEKGRLYLGDIGNNLGLFRARSIYRFDEPDPSKQATGAIVPSASYSFALPDGNPFDAESLVCDHGLATLIVKAHDRRDATMFTLDLETPAPLARPAALTAAGRLSHFVEPATGASLSDDGRLLAVCSSSVVRVYHRPTGTAWELLSQVKYQPMAAEGLAWDKNDLILAVERGGLYRISEQTWRTAAEKLSKPRSGGVKGDR